jgi:hypothetical protein
MMEMAVATRSASLSLLLALITPNRKTAVSTERQVLSFVGTERSESNIDPTCEDTRNQRAGVTPQLRHRIAQEGTRS